MRRITLFIIHCSATRCGQPYSFEDCRRDHIDGRHFRDIGYHYYITRDGRVHPGRPLSLEGRTASVTTATASASATKGDWTAKASRQTLARLPRRLPSRSCCKSWAATSRQLSP